MPLLGWVARQAKPRTFHAGLASWEAFPAKKVFFLIIPVFTNAIGNVELSM